MRSIRLLTAAASVALLSAPAMAQNSNTSTNNTGSEANAGSASVSGAESNGNQQGQGQSQTANNAGIGSSRNENTSTSASGAISGSESESRAASDQNQGQGQGQGQGQSQDARNSQSQGQSTTTSATQAASNMQGVATNITFNSTNHKRSYVGTNTAVPLAASSSFSSDYCGGTVSGGASVAPIGLSLGASGIKIDKSCQYLRKAEKFGMLGANYYNMRQPEMAMRAMSMMAWSICMADSDAGYKKGHQSASRATVDACLAMALMGSDASPPPAPQPYQEPAPVSPLETQKPNETPTTYGGVPDDYGTPKTPRGDAGTPPPIAAVVH